MRLYCPLIWLFLFAVPMCFAEENKINCKACGDSPSKRESGDKGGIYGPPWVCPLFELLAMGDGNLYYCDYFETVDCTDEPQAVYAFGDFATPTACSENDCFSGWGRVASFKGLDFKIPESYIHAMPSGSPREYSQVSVVQSLQFIKCKADNDSIFAKVFAIALDLRGLKAGIPTSMYTRTIHVAFETSANPSVFEDISDCKPVGLATSSGKNYVFRATYLANNGIRRIPILVLKAKRP